MCVPRDLLEPTRAEITAMKGGEKPSNIFVFFPGLFGNKVKNSGSRNQRDVTIRLCI